MNEQPMTDTDAMREAIRRQGQVNEAQQPMTDTDAMREAIKKQA